MLSCMCNMDRGVVFVQKNNEFDEICCISCTILCVLFKKIASHKRSVNSSGTSAYYNSK